MAHAQVLTGVVLPRSMGRTKICCVTPLELSMKLTMNWLVGVLILLSELAVDLGEIGHWRTDKHKYRSRQYSKREYATTRLRAFIFSWLITDKEYKIYSCRSEHWATLATEILNARSVNVALMERIDLSLLLVLLVNGNSCLTGIRYSLQRMILAYLMWVDLYPFLNPYL